MVSTPILAKDIAQTFEPVMIEVRGSHAYKNRGKGRNGCGATFSDGAICMAAQTHRSHLSLPLSLNVVGSRGGNFTYKSFKAAWEELLHEQLEASGLPAGWRKDAPPETPKIRSIYAEGLLCFPAMRKERDQGNFRWFLEKCLGDTLDKGGWIVDDSYWPETHFEFGGLQFEHRPGEAWTRIMLFCR